MGEVSLRQRLVDDHRPGGRLVIALRQITSLQDGNTQAAEIAGTHFVKTCPQFLPGGGNRAPDNLKSTGLNVSGRREVTDSRGDDAWNSPDALENLTVENVSFRRNGFHEPARFTRG